MMLRQPAAGYVVHIGRDIYFLSSTEEVEVETEKKTRRGNYLWVVILGLILIISLLSFGVNFLREASTNPTPTVTPEPSPTIPAEVTVEPSDAPTPTMDEQLAKVDESLRQSMLASIAYNEPQTMELQETITLELLLNPSVLPPELGSLITEPGEVITSSVEVTPRMKAELIPRDAEAFIIQPLHDSPEQFISGTETTRWNWDVTAAKGGKQRLTLIIYRLVVVDGTENWRQIETYRSDIEVTVTLGQRLAMLDWKWFAGILIPALFIPALWRYMDNRNKKRKKRSK